MFFDQVDILNIIKYVFTDGLIVLNIIAYN